MSARPWRIFGETSIGYRAVGALGFVTSCATKEAALQKAEALIARGNPVGAHSLDYVRVSVVGPGGEGADFERANWSSSPWREGAIQVEPVGR